MCLDIISSIQLYYYAKIILHCMKVLSGKYFSEMNKCAMHIFTLVGKGVIVSVMFLHKQMLNG